MYQLYYLLRKLLPAVYRMDRREKRIYLTFDDGPCEESTSTILDILNRQKVKATFFCIGENVMKYQQLFLRISSEGHSIGNHTMHHTNGFSCRTKQYIRDIDEANTHIQSNLFRPPYGRIYPWQLRRLRKDYKIICWDVIAYDWDKKRTPEDVANIIKKYTRNGSIIVLHDSKKAAPRTLIMLEETIIWLKTEGYEFATL